MPQVTDVKPTDDTAKKAAVDAWLYLISKPAAERIEIITRWLDGNAAATTCWLMGHEQRIEALRAEIDELKRRNADLLTLCAQLSAH